MATDIEDLLASLAAPSAGDNVLKPFITVSNFADYFKHKCDLFLHKSITEKYLDAQRSAVPPQGQDNPNDFAKRGVAWENSLYAKLDIKPIDKAKLDATRTQLEMAARLGNIKWIAQPSFFCETSLFGSTIYFSRFYIDLLQVEKVTTDGKVTTIKFKVIDAKSTSQVQLSQRIQVAIYILLLREIFNDWNAGALQMKNLKFEVSNEGGVWLIGNDQPTTFQVEQLEVGIQNFLQSGISDIWKAKVVQPILHEHDCNNCDYINDCLKQAQKNQSVNLIHGLSKFKKEELLLKGATLSTVLNHIDNSDILYHRIQVITEAIQNNEIKFHSNVISSYLDAHQTNFVAIGLDFQNNLGVHTESKYSKISEGMLVTQLHLIVSALMRNGSRTQIIVNSKYECKMLESILHQKTFGDSVESVKSWELLCTLFLSPEIASLDAIPESVMNNNVIVLPDVLSEIAALPKPSPFWNLQDWLTAFGIQGASYDDKLQESTRNALLVIKALLNRIRMPNLNCLRPGVVEPMKFPAKCTFTPPLDKLYFMESIEASLELKMAHKMRTEMPVSDTNEWLMELQFIGNQSTKLGDSRRNSMVTIFCCLSRNANFFLKEGPFYLLSPSQDQLWNYKDSQFDVSNPKTYAGCFNVKWQEEHGDFAKELQECANMELVVFGGISLAISSKWAPGTTFYCTKVVYNGNLKHLKDVSLLHEQVKFVFNPAYMLETWQHQSPYLQHKINLLWGPPGSGKTFTCCDILENSINQSNNKKQIIFVTAFTKQAIFNIINLMSQQITKNDKKNISLLWLGKNNESLPVNVIWVDKASDVTMWFQNNDFSNHTRVVFGTTWKFAKFRTQLQACDLLIIDEGSQMPVMHALLPISLMKTNAKVLVIGDYRQLPPVRREEYPALQNLEKSILHYWWYHPDIQLDQRKMLNLNWRMNSHLCQQLKYLYPQYVSETKAAAHTLQKKHISLDGVDPVLLPIISEKMQHSSIVIETNCEDPTKEANLIHNIGRLIDGYTHVPESNNTYPFLIAIVPHHSQRRKLEALGFYGSVGTVHSFQGMSCEVSVISLGFLTKQQVPQERKFLNLELINVATTRARAKNILILSDKLLIPPIHDDPGVTLAYNHLKTIYGNSIVIKIDEEHPLMKI